MGLFLSIGVSERTQSNRVDETQIYPVRKKTSWLILMRYQRIIVSEAIKHDLMQYYPGMIAYSGAKRSFFTNGLCRAVCVCPEIFRQNILWRFSKIFRASFSFVKHE